MKIVLSIILFLLNVPAMNAMNSQKETPPLSSIEDLLAGLSVQEKKELTETYEQLNSTLEVAAILIPTDETTLKEKKAEFKKFCIRKYAHSSQRDSKGSN